MRPPLIELLNQIAAGVVIFEPFRRDAQGLREFQDTVERLQELERLGWVGRLFVQSRPIRGAEYVNLVMVQGGLTAEGRRVLAEHKG
jgi:hypothetical protein